jgi:heme a synthase
MPDQNNLKILRENWSLLNARAFLSQPSVFTGFPCVALHSPYNSISSSSLLFTVLMFIVQLALIGAGIALIPLSWILLRKRTESLGRLGVFGKLVWVITFLTLDLVIFGSFTRLTDSGLGCPDWPGCYQTSSPLHAHQAIRTAQAAKPDGPVTMVKAWIEMTHRYLALALGALITVQAGLAWMQRKQLRSRWRLSPWQPTALLLLVCIQGAFGAWTVTLKLHPAIVTLHLLLGLLLLGAQGVLAVRCTASLPPSTPRPGQTAALFGLGLLALQISLGGWVSTNDAVLACTGFPTCNGAWLPPMDFAQGFELWRALGRTGNGDVITQNALVAIHWTHRLFALIVTPYLIWLGLHFRRFSVLRHSANGLIALVIVQFVTGLFNVVLQWPLLIALVHSAGSAILWLLLVMLNAKIFFYNASYGMLRALFTRCRDYYTLTKPRVTLLAVFCAVIGMCLATPGRVPWPVLLGGASGIWLLASAAFALNCLAERKIDSFMRRTQQRASVRGTIKPAQIIGFSALLSAAGILILATFTNMLTVWLTLATFTGYVLIYTILLKPATPQNIVIGGAFGALPPALGWAAATGTVSAEAWVLVLIIFVWTPPHFWALALYRRHDYAQAKLPMLSITHGEKFTRLHILLYTIILFVISLLPFTMKMSGIIYLAAAIVLGVLFLVYAWKIWQHYSDALARKLFRYSIIYLALLFSVLLLDHTISIT